jgi:hypothetical protein
MAMRPDAAFYSHVMRGLDQGRLTPFLGAGANVSGAGTEPFAPGLRLPSGTELARHLAREFSFPGTDDDDLVRVAQWVLGRLGRMDLYEYLHRVFDYDYAPTSLHQLLPKMTKRVRHQHGNEFPLIITTNYDDALERAFQAAGEEFDLLTYLAYGQHQGMFRHTDPSGRPNVIEKSEDYEEVTLRQRPAIVKLHGAVQRGAPVPDKDSYVVTEDDYIECLTRTDIVKFLPPAVVGRMRRCHYLFLGYSLRDWNFRAILHQIRRDCDLDNESWVVLTDPDPLEEKAWRKRGVETYDLDLNDFARALEVRLASPVEEVG